MVRFFFNVKQHLWGESICYQARNHAGAYESSAFQVLLCPERFVYNKHKKILPS